MIVVAVAMIGSLTVLPALLSKLGDRVEKGRIPFLRPAPAPERREPLLVGDPDAGAAAPARVGRRRRRRAARAGRAGAAACTPRSPGSTRCRRASPTVETIDKIQDGVPGQRRPRRSSRSRPTPTRPRRPRRSRELQHAGARERPDARARSRSTSTPAHTVARVAIPLDGQRHRRTSRTPRCDTLRNDDPAGDDRHGAGRDVRGHRRHGGVGRRERDAQALGAARVRLRAHVRVPAAAGLVPLDRDRGQGDRAEPAVGRRRLRRARRDLPVRLGREPPELPVQRRHRARGCRSSCS